MTKLNYQRPIFRKGKEIKIDEGNKPVEMRVYLLVSYRDKDFVKKLGASWDPNHKLWFTYPSHPNIQKMKDWIHEDDYERCGINGMKLNQIRNLLKTLKTK